MTRKETARDIPFKKCPNAIQSLAWEVDKQQLVFRVGFTLLLDSY